MSRSAARFSLDGADVLILGGTGSLGNQLCRRILAGEGSVRSVTIFSRDEAKQHSMRMELTKPGSEFGHVDANRARLHFAIGDVRDLADLRRSVERADVVFHAAAMKQIPTCEYFGRAAVDTNVYGAINLARVIAESTRRDKHVVGVSTDKACKPVSVMGMTKALQERMFVQAALETPDARFVNVRYGNVIASRGSVVHTFADYVKHGQAIPITDHRMTRFLMTLDQSVDLIMAAFADARTGETWVPMVPSAKLMDIAYAVADRDDYPIETVGIRPGEKLHEVLVSEEETPRTVLRGSNAVILPILPELRSMSATTALPFEPEYTSEHGNLGRADVRALLEKHLLATEPAPT